MIMARMIVCRLAVGLAAVFDQEDHTVLFGGTLAWSVTTDDSSQLAIATLQTKLGPATESCNWGGQEIFVNSRPI